jgi:hypothetical protein
VLIGKAVAGAVLALVTGAACATPSSPTVRESSSSPTSKTSDGVGTVTEAKTYDSGQIRVDPISDGYQPEISQEMALKGLESKVGVPAGDGPAVLLVQFSRFTDQPRSDGPGYAVTPDHQPVWFFHWTNVPVSGGLPRPGSGSISTFLEDSYGFVGSDTGINYLYNVGMPLDKKIMTFPPSLQPGTKPSPTPSQS